MYKKGDVFDVENYRPIALLSVFSNIFERAYSTRLNTFLNKNGLFTSRKYGFRKGKSIQDAVLSFYEKILNELWGVVVYFRK